jgi:hypothetical protein
MLTLATLRDLAARGVKMTPLVERAGLHPDTYGVRVKRGTPDLTPDESRAIATELRALRDAITRALR